MGRRLIEGPGCFDSRPGPRLVRGPGAVSALPALLPEVLPGVARPKVLVVTDAGLVTAGHAGLVMGLLEGCGARAELMSESQENPTGASVAACAEVARRHGSELFIGLGGGSSIDTARGALFLLSGGGEMADYKGYGLGRGAMRPLIAIPTTSGTGSECQSFALIADSETHVKMACGDSRAAAAAAILDPELTLSQPRHVTATTGLDALVHALETAVTTARTPLSLMFSREAFARLLPNLPKVLAEPGDITARAEMQLGAALAGLAIENSMLGAAHATANPLTARLGLVHGQAVALMAPAVIAHNLGDPEARALYAELAAAAGLRLDELLPKLREVMALAGRPAGIAALGLPRSELPALAAEAAEQWTGRFNPRPLSGADFEALYEAAWEDDNV